MRTCLFVLIALWATFLDQPAFCQSKNEVRASASASASGIAPGKVAVGSFVGVFIGKGAPAHSIAYEYEFPGRAFVHVNGLGTVPGRGSYRYLTLEKTLEFRDPATGEVLRQVPLVETVIVAAKPPLTEVATQFPSAFRTFLWDSQDSLKERANAVLNKYFRYLPGGNQETALLTTTFTPLQLRDVSGGVLGQVALLLSFPNEPTKGSYPFHVQAAVREGRALSDELRPTNNPSIIRAADKFVDTLVEEMKRGR